LTQYSSSAAAASGALQWHVGEGHEPVGVLPHDRRQVLVDGAGGPLPKLRIEGVLELEGRAGDGLDVDPHLVHVAQSLLH
jgi:hypothetical protein